MAIWPVFVEDWQQDCCGEPFEIGSEIAWWLLLIDEADAYVPEKYLVPVEAAAEPSPNGRWTLVRAGGLAACLSRHPGHEERISVRGHFAEDHHARFPEDLPQTRGRVRGIRRLGSGKLVDLEVD